MCAICSRAFRNNWDLNRHSKIHNMLLLLGGKKERVKTERAKRATADIDFANNNIASSGANNNSTEASQGPLGSQTYCQLCSKDFKTSWSLQRHEAVHSTLNRPFKCQSCTSAFKSKSALTTHTQRTHATDISTEPPSEEPRPLILCPRCAVFSCFSLADLDVHHETCELEAVASELVCRNIGVCCGAVGAHGS